jgi:hypothetical protein
MSLGRFTHSRPARASFRGLEILAAQDHRLELDPF